MSIENIIEQLVAHENQNVDEFNDVFDKYTRMEQAYKNLKAEHLNANALLTSQKHIINDYKSRHQQHQREYNKLNVVAQNAAVTEKELVKLRKEFKTLKEQTKRIKAANVEKDKKISRIEGKMAQYTQSSSEIRLTKQGFLQNANLGAVYTLFTNANNEGELLQLYPHKLTMRAENGKVMEGYVLIHTNNTGTLVTVALDTENEAKLLSPLDFPEDTPDRTRTLANKFLRPMSPEASAFARQWLYRVNVSQKGELKLHDLDNTPYL